MRELTDQAQQIVNNLAQRYGASPDAVRTLLDAVVAGSGTMAQFSHPELGGSGQWMSGGMTMVGDMFNHGLQAKVSGICAELSNFTASQQVYVPLPVMNSSYSSQQQQSGFGGYGSSQWPAELGQPSSSGGQNDFRYAYFPSTRRLAVQDRGQLRIYDTLDHQIGGVSQQQSGYGGGSFTFSSQYGQFSVESLPLAQGQGHGQTQQPQAQSPQAFSPAPAFVPQPEPVASSNFGNSSNLPDGRDDVFSALDRLGNLRDRGIVTEEEFLAKKRELLARL
jgi:hypothetical protein